MLVLAKRLLQDCQVPITAPAANDDDDKLVLIVQPSDVLKIAYRLSSIDYAHSHKGDVSPWCLYIKGQQVVNTNTR